MEALSGFFRKITFASAVLVVVAPMIVSGLAAEDFKTGRAFREALNGRIRFQSTGTLGGDLASLSENSGVAICLDREIDPSQNVPFPTELQPLGQTLEEVAESLQGLALNVGSFVYIAPRQKALRFLVLRNIQAYRLDSLPPELKNRLEKFSDLEWPRLGQPRSLVESMATDCGLVVANPESIPHDLWSAKRLPRLAHWEQLTFLLACMNQTYLIDEASGSLQVIALTADQQVTLRFAESESRRIKSLIQAQRPTGLRQVVQGDYCYLRGSLADCESLIGNLLPRRNWKNETRPGSRDVFDLNTHASRGSILMTIARNRKVELKFSPEVAEVLQQKVRIEVKQVTLEELLQQILQGTGLDYRLDDTQLLIVQ